jgi:hypothetical protein
MVALAPSTCVAYQWNLAQVEYATDIVFRRREDLAPIYETLVRTAVHSVKAAHVATFLGRRLMRNNSEEIGNDFDTRIQGTRVGPCRLSVSTNPSKTEFFAITASGEACITTVPLRKRLVTTR